MFNKKLEERIERLEKEVAGLRKDAEITFEDENSFWGSSTVGVSDILTELLDKLGYKLKRKSPNVKVKYLNKK